MGARRERCCRLARAAGRRLEFGAVGDQADGTCSADVAGVGADKQYQYVLTTAPALPPKVDPYARDAGDGGSKDANAAVVYDEQASDWGLASWNAPGWTELVIYELRVGSFSRQPGADVGTFADVTAKLPYLQSLGINVIELLPVAEFEGDISWAMTRGAVQRRARLRRPGTA